MLNPGARGLHTTARTIPEWPTYAFQKSVVIASFRVRHSPPSPVFTLDILRRNCCHPAVPGLGKPDCLLRNSLAALHTAALAAGRSSVRRPGPALPVARYRLSSRAALHRPINTFPAPIRGNDPSRLPTLLSPSCRGTWTSSPPCSTSRAELAVCPDTCVFPACGVPR